MRVSDFDFDLPPDRIAKHPARPRDAARLLCVGRGLEDCRIQDLPRLLRPGDVVVLNDTRVIPARLFGLRGKTRIEVLLHRALDASRWQVFAKPAKRLKVGDTLMFEGLAAVVEEKYDSGEIRLRFDRSGSELMSAVEALGVVPLPPYIRRDADARDRMDYQTIYAREGVSVAAPTAGLHFTPELLTSLEKCGVLFAHVTLHVGAGTFQPVKAENIEEHVMHAEVGEISPEAALIINDSRAKGGRVIAVGTTSCRLLETAVTPSGTVRPFSGETDIFMTPGYRFRVVDVLMTNFHLPKSTLFMLVCAFSGMERMKMAYRHAIEKGYRFYSYGDACLLERA